MSELSTRFEAAVADSQSLSTRPSNDVLLRLYALYKQATVGDVEGSRPGFTDMRGRAKYDAWAAISGTDSNEAMEQYIEQIEELKKKL
jgi:acyl-CoA-binding protein